MPPQATKARALPFEILAVGRYPPERIKVTYRDVPRPTTPALDAAIADEWDRRLALAQHNGQSLYDGKLVRYLAHEQHAGWFALQTAPTCYRDFVGTNLYNNHRLAEFGWAAFANPIGTTAILRTADDFLVLGRRSPRVAFHAGFVHTIGGTLEQVDLRADNTVDVFASVGRELEEEVGARSEDLTDLTCVGLVRDRFIHQPELLFDATTRLTLSELILRARTAPGADEHCGLVALSAERSSVVPFLLQHERVAPVAAAALVLLGMRFWGSAWFDGATRALRERDWPTE